MQSVRKMRSHVPVQEAPKGRCTFSFPPGRISNMWLGLCNARFNDNMGMACIMPAISEPHWPRRPALVGAWITSGRDGQSQVRSISSK